jgi:hypothetical protein
MKGQVCQIPGCGRPFRAKGYCMTQYMRWRAHGDPLKVTGRVAAAAIVIEDVEWMAQTGESLLGAAHRLEVHPDTLERRLEREGRYDLANQMRARNPRVVAR